MNKEIKDKAQVILKEHGLDFRIEKLPMVAPRTEGGIITNVATDYFGLYNDKTKEIINTCKDSYVVSQNDELVELVLTGMAKFGELSVSKAGSLDGGRKVFIQLAVDGLSKVGDDKIKRYVTIIDSNDGSTGLSVGIGDLTMSCQNQFFRFYRSGMAKWRHSASLLEKMSTIPSLIELSLSEGLRMIEIYNAFKSNKVSRELAHKMVNHLLGIDRTMKSALIDKSTRSMNAMESLYNAIETEMNQKGDNLWGLHSGVTRWTTHDKSAPKRENGRIESLSVGTNYRTNQESLAFALDYAGIKI
ncbi:MAG: DUF932 domain-containing protein [Bacteroidota bacterium]